MKLKYYLRGLGIGIIVTTIILMISFSGRKEEISDEEVIARATQLGMVMPEDEPSESSEDDAAPEDGADDQTDAADAAPAADTPDGQTPANGQQDAEGELSAEDLLAQTQNDAAEAEADTPDQADGTDAANTTPVANAEGSFRLTIQKGDVCRVVCEKLAEGGVITDAEALRKYLFEIGYASNMSIGEYDIPYGATNEEIASILQEGPIE